MVREAVRSVSCFACESRMRLSSVLTRVWILSSVSFARVESVYSYLALGHNISKIRDQ